MISRAKRWDPRAPPFKRGPGLEGASPTRRDSMSGNKVCNGPKWVKYGDGGVFPPIGSWTSSRGQMARWASGLEGASSTCLAKDNRTLLKVVEGSTIQKGTHMEENRCLELGLDQHVGAAKSKASFAHLRATASPARGARDSSGILPSGVVPCPLCPFTPEWGMFQNWPVNGQIGYITPAVWGVPNASERGTKSEVAHKWTDWLHHPCRLGGPNTHPYAHGPHRGKAHPAAVGTRTCLTRQPSILLVAQRGDRTQPPVLAVRVETQVGGRRGRNKMKVKPSRCAT